MPSELSHRVEGKEFCLIGGTGLVGRTLAGRLRQLGARRVIVFSRTNSNPGPDSFSADIVDPRFASDANIPTGSIVFHLAGMKNAGAGAQLPCQCFDINTRGTWHLLEACRRVKIEKLVFASTWMVYGNPAQLPLSESEPPLPLSVYAASKLAAENVIRGYAKQYGMKTVLARLANVYGEEADRETVWGHIVTLAASGEDIHVRDLSPVRDYIHVEDAADALIALSSVPQETDCLVANVSSGKGTSVHEMALIVAGEVELQTGNRPKISGGSVACKGTESKIVVDNTRLRQMTGWEPRWDLETGLKNCFRTERISKNSCRKISNPDG